MLCELPTASSHFGSTGVLWVLTGTHPCGPPSRMMEVTRAPALCGMWSWSCRRVVLWSHREVWKYECISTPLHWLPRLLNLVVSLRFALQASLSVLQHNLCILHMLGIQSRDHVLHLLLIVALREVREHDILEIRGALCHCTCTEVWPIRSSSSTVSMRSVFTMPCTSLMSCNTELSFWTLLSDSVFPSLSCFPCEDQSLLVGMNAFLVLDLCLHIVDGDTGLRHRT